MIYCELLVTAGILHWDVINVKRKACRIVAIMGRNTKLVVIIGNVYAVMMISWNQIRVFGIV